MSSPTPYYRRVLLKLSGEALMGDGKYGVDPQTLQRIATQVQAAAQLGTEVGIVVGGGNIFRGMAASAQGMEPASADYVGMLATVMNAIALQDALEKLGAKTRVQSAIEMQALCEPYIRRRAIRHLEKGRIVIFAGGTGNPFFTTDTAAALRAMEIGAQIIMKATKVDGVYSADPKKDPSATRFDRLTYIEVLQKRLSVMDSTAISLCMEHDLPILVFNMTEPANIVRAVRGEPIGTIVAKTSPGPSETTA